MTSPVLTPAGVALADRPGMQLLVRRSTMVAEDVITLDLVDPDGARLTPWSPGSHLELILPSGLIRHYSLCGDLDDAYSYRVSVRRDPRSRGGSAEIHDSGLVGKTVGVNGPRNHFPLIDAPSYLFVAGGIGITPILPMLQAVEGRRRPWQLLYIGSSRSRMAFLDEVSRRRGGTCRIAPKDEVGSVDIARAVQTTEAGTAVFCCGPERMLDEVQVLAGRLADRLVHVERFGAPGGDPAGAGADGEARTDQAFEVELARTGAVLTVSPGQSVLDAVLDVAPHQLYSCEEGYCGTCQTRVLSGEPDHRDSILTSEQRREYMMICVSRCRSGRLVLDI